jgi:MFS family permease
VYVGEVMHLPGESIGWLTGAFIVSQTASNVLWGLFGDRRGFRDVMVGALVVWIASTILFLYAESFTAVVLGFVGLGIGLGGFMLASVNLVLEFGAREDLPMRIAMAQTAEQLVTVVAPLGGGLLIAAFSYAHMFWLSAGVQAFALIVILRLGAEPRRRKQPALAELD